MIRSDLKATTASVELDNSHQGEKLILGHGPLAEFLTENSFPTSKSTIAKYCSPAINTGPSVYAYWGRLPVFKPSVVLAWARARLRPPNEARVRDGAGQEAHTVASSPVSTAPSRKRGRPPKVRTAADATGESQGHRIEASAG